MGRTIDLSLSDEYEGRFIFDSKSRLTKVMIKRHSEPITEFREVDTDYIGKELKVADLPDLVRESNMLSNIIYRTDWFSNDPSRLRSFSTKDNY